MYWGAEFRKANISLRLFSAKLDTYYGSECTGSLSDEWLTLNLIILLKTMEKEKIANQINLY